MERSDGKLTRRHRPSALWSSIAGGGSGRETIHHVSPARTYQRLQTISSSIFSGQERRYGKRKKSFVTNHHRLWMSVPPTGQAWVGGWSATQRPEAKVASQSLRSTSVLRSGAFVGDGRSFLSSHPNKRSRASGPAPKAHRCPKRLTKKLKEKHNV